MKGSLVLAMMTVVGLGCAETAHAQSGTPESLLEGRQPRKVTVIAQAKAEYDTNIARGSASLAALRGLTRADTIYSPSLNIDAVMPVDRQVVFLNGVVGYLFHDANARLDRSRIDVTGGAGGELGPCGVIASGGYLTGRSELEDRTLVADVSNVRTVKRVSLSARCSTPTGLGLVLNGSRDWGDNSAQLANEQDFEMASATAGISYARQSVGSITLIGSYSRTEYPHRIIITAGTPGYEVIGAAVELKRRLGARLEAAVQGGYSRVNLLAPLPPAPGAPADVLSEFQGWTYSGNLSFRPSSRIQANAIFEKKISPTLIAGRSYEIQTNYTLRASYRLGSRFTMSAGAILKDSDSRGGVPIGANFLTDSRTKVAVASIRYRQSDRLSFELTGQYEDRKADVSSFNYDSERIGIATNLAF